jgi:hypothetical protein
LLLRSGVRLYVLILTFLLTFRETVRPDKRSRWLKLLLKLPELGINRLLLLKLR